MIPVSQLLLIGRLYSIGIQEFPFCLLEIQDKVEEGRSKEGYQETGRQEADQEAC